MKPVIHLAIEVPTPGITGFDLRPRCATGKQIVWILRNGNLTEDHTLVTCFKCRRLTKEPL